MVFFKLCLVGYLENIISDRKLISHCSMRMDILCFIGYHIEDELPWHSTISRTRQLFPESLFEGAFTKVPTEYLETHLHQFRHISRMDKPHRQSKENKASKNQQTISANKQELGAIKSRNKEWEKDQALH